MSRLEVLDAVCDALEAPHGSLKGPEELKSIGGWDSLVIMGLIALMDERYSVVLSPAKLTKCRTVDELVETAIASRNA